MLGWAAHRTHTVAPPRASPALLILRSHIRTDSRQTIDLVDSRWQFDRMASERSRQNEATEDSRAGAGCRLRAERTGGGLGLGHCGGDLRWADDVYGEKRKSDAVNGRRRRNQMRKS